MKNKIIKSFCLIALCISMLSSVVYGLNVEHVDKEGKTTKLSDFLDTKGHWAHSQILKWGDYGVIYGNNGYFMPNNNVTRGDFCIMVDRMLGLKDTTYNYFTDMTSQDYFRESVLKCVASGYINGTGGNRVNPRGYATREEVAVILCRIFNIDTSYSGPTSFVDNYEIGTWSRPSISALSRLGYMNGTTGGLVKPKSNITRAEIITLLNNIADTYISKKDIDNTGSTFVGSYPRNIVTARNIELKNSTVGRDMYLSQATNSLVLTNTTIRGRLVAMGRNTITMTNSSIEQILLKDGKSNLSGISEKINEIYVCQFASESSLDSIPNKLILESGVRVRIDGVMYENTSSSIKTYYGTELKADISDEQGYVVGGPKVSGVKYSVGNSNILTVSDVRVVAGENTVKEVGVIWLDNDEDKDPINPTYKKNDGKSRYTGKYNEPFTYEVGEISGYRTYRVYVRDSEGLYAYSTPYTTKAFTYSTDIKVTAVDYPEKLNVDVVLQGTNVPNIKNIQVIYDVDELYSEKHNLISLRRFEDNYAENPVDATKYKRYTATITVASHTDPKTNEKVYEVPTAFGYIIEFSDGSILNRFPVVTNVVPSGIKPVRDLSLGAITFSGDSTILLTNNKIVTNNVTVQEVGLIYQEALSSSIANPSENASGWTRVRSETNIGKNQTILFDSSVRITNTSANTFIAPYVLTSNGYYYGSVSKVSNNWQGDEGGPRINGSPNALVLSSNSVLVAFPISRGDIDVTANDCIISMMENGVENTKWKNSMLSSLSPCYSDLTGTYYLLFDGLKANTDYNVTFKVRDISGLSSNVTSVVFKTSDLLPISLINKQVESNGIVSYEVSFPDSNYVLNTNGHTIQGNGSSISAVGNTLILSNDSSKGKEMYLSMSFKVHLSEGSKVYEFVRMVIAN